MIILFEINCKSYEEKILKNYKFFDYECPKCGAKHSLTRHGVYERNITSIENDIFIDKKIKVLRLKCKSCQSTHGLLPNDVIPYCVYSYSCIIKILTKHYNHRHSVLSLSNKYSISFQLIYSFIQRFTEFIKECILTLKIIGLIKQILYPSIEQLLSLINRINPITFLQIYFNNNQFIFLMKKFRNIIPCPININAINSQNHITHITFE